MNEMFPTFKRFFAWVRRNGLRPARFLGRAARKSWKPVLLTLLIINAVFSLSSYLERKYMPKPIVETSMWDREKYNSSKNPFRHYETAVRMIQDKDREVLENLWDSKNKYSRVIPPTAEQAKIALMHMQPAFTELRNGAACRGEDYEIQEKKPSFTEYSPELYWFRKLAKLAAYDAVGKVKRGQTRDGLAELIAVIEMGNDFRRKGPPEYILVGHSIVCIGQREIMKLLNRLSEDDSCLRLVCSELARLDSQSPGLESDLKTEYAFTRRAMQEFFWLSWPQSIDILDTDSVGITALMYCSIPGMRTWMLRNYDRMWGVILSRYDEPYPVLIKLELNRTVPKLDFINRILSGLLNRFFEVDARDKTLNHGIMLMAALEAYRLEHGQYPDKLDALVGIYIKKLPTDPFADGKPFIYSRKGNEYLLYSVGLDMKDNGGKKLGRDARHNETGDYVFAPGADVWPD